MTRAFALLLLSSSCSFRDLSYLDECTSTNCSAYQAEVESDGPVLYLRLGEREGPIAVDRAGDLDGTYPAGGVTFGAPGAIAGDPDTAISFDGTSAISMPPGFDLSGNAPFTFEVWVQLKMPISDFVFAIDHESYDVSRDGWGLLLFPDKINFERWRDDSSAGIVGSDEPLTVETFHHVVVTFDGNELVLYIDDEVAGPFARAPAISPLLPRTNSWTLGTQNLPSPGAGLVGSLDELAIYPTALTEQRITAHYRASGR